ncbi:hypothetical protein [Treponema sp. Marseille-Q4132]|uniref:hypothetical protein n=1 Tax=Treponema sp. Marseille-Q4132 TaxID=2766701 RepID=UPI0016532946|nr:hypothetical protein [Treponema sp. Marseille-Q4132]QNL97133.1 hypothetical protein H9I35_12095 [Treponema sp. Marseille-Q4132]
MEELRSTEVLDKEIETDARKKAERILAKADSDGKALVADVAHRIEKFTEEKTAEYQKKTENYRADRDAVVPLEKERFLVSFIESAIVKAIDSYLDALGEEKRIALAVRRWNTYKSVVASQKVNAFVFGFDAARAETALKKEGVSLASCTPVAYEKSGDEGIDGLTFNEGIILETEDKMIRCRLTLSQIVGELETEYRAELAKALFGGRFDS